MEHLFDHAPGTTDSARGTGNTDRLGVADVTTRKIVTDPVFVGIGERLCATRLSGQGRRTYMRIVKFVIAVITSRHDSADVLKIVCASNIGAFDGIARNAGLDF